MNYYNENDPKTAAWLRELIRSGLIPEGKVDERSIADVQPRDLEGFTQSHFFAGIGGWSYALQLAGWPADRPVWTGSCPCQPFSAAGKQRGTADDRHLWPEFRRLIAERNPPIVFGEQVASALGREWLAGVRVDLEDLGYAVGAADLCAASVGAPHIRQRLWWVAHAANGGLRIVGVAKGGLGQPSRCGEPDRMADMQQQGLEGHARNVNDCHQPGRDVAQASRSASQGGGIVRLDHASHAESTRLGQQREQLYRPTAWSAFDTIQCHDGKTRRIEPGTFPLAHGVSGRVGMLRGYGNAIVPQVAAEFVKAYLQTVTL